MGLDSVVQQPYFVDLSSDSEPETYSFKVNQDKAAENRILIHVLKKKGKKRKVLGSSKATEKAPKQVMSKVVASIPSMDKDNMKRAALKKAGSFYLLEGFKEPYGENGKSADVSDDEEDDCLILDHDPTADKNDIERNCSSPSQSAEGEGDETVLVAEKGMVACRDFPHARHSCAAFPFGKTLHGAHCEQCHCYVCDVSAPCLYWGDGSDGAHHCHATDKEASWKLLRKFHKLGDPPPPPRPSAAPKRATLQEKTTEARRSGGAVVSGAGESLSAVLRDEAPLYRVETDVVLGRDEGPADSGENNVNPNGAASSSARTSGSRSGAATAEPVIVPSANHPPPPVDPYPETPPPPPAPCPASANQNESLWEEAYHNWQSVPDPPSSSTSSSRSSTRSQTRGKEMEGRTNEMSQNTSFVFGQVPVVQSAYPVYYQYNQFPSVVATSVQHGGDLNFVPMGTMAYYGHLNAGMNYHQYALQQGAIEYARQQQLLCQYNANQDYLPGPVDSRTDNKNSANVAPNSREASPRWNEAHW